MEFCKHVHFGAAKIYSMPLSGLTPWTNILRKKQKNIPAHSIHKVKLGYVLCKSSCYNTPETGKFKSPKKTQLTCFSKRLSPVESWSVMVPFSVLSRGLARINAIQISTWVCKKLFHVYLKNMSWKTNSTRFTQTKVF